jgi:hypothetical protein
MTGEDTRLPGAIAAFISHGTDDADDADDANEADDADATHDAHAADDSNDPDGRMVQKLLR